MRIIYDIVTWFMALAVIVAIALSVYDLGFFEITVPLAAVAMPLPLYRAFRRMQAGVEASPADMRRGRIAASALLLSALTFCAGMLWIAFQIGDEVPAYWLFGLGSLLSLVALGFGIAGFRSRFGKAIVAVALSLILIVVGGTMLLALTVGSGGGWGVGG